MLYKSALSLAVGNRCPSGGHSSIKAILESAVHLIPLTTPPAEIGKTRSNHFIHIKSLNDFEYRRIPSSHQRKLSEQSWESQTNVNWQLFNSDSTIEKFNHLGSTAHCSWEVDIGVYHGQHGQHESEGDRKVLLQVLWFKPRSGRVVGKAGETGAGAERLDETCTGPHNLAPLEDEVAERRGGSRKRQGRNREETSSHRI